jgi:NDP-sugar pyrophosphorylase family protein
MRTVLLPTSGTGSRLFEITQFTNKSLIPVGDKYAICHIIEYYPPDTEFIITLGYYGNQVRDFLELAYPERKFTFVQVDRYEGEGSSLGYSMLKAKSLLEMGPFYFHCCDTILEKQETWSDPSENTLLVGKTDSSEQYATVCGTNSKVTSLQKKGASQFDFMYTGVSYIKDSQEFWNELEKLYQDNPNNQALSDVGALQALLTQGYTFLYDLQEDVYDTGNLKSYAATTAHFKSKYEVLAKPNESLCFFPTKVIKFNADEKVNEKRYKRGQLLYPLVPKIYGYRSNFISMEFIQGTVVCDVSTYGEVHKILEWATKNVWTKAKTDKEFEAACMRFYKTKTFDRIKALPFLDRECNVVNGINTGSIYSLLENTDFQSLCQSTFTQFHGDFILDNILKTQDSYILLDWRHEFDSQLEYGDRYYDLAKLRHNIIFNHKNITQGLFTIEQKDNEVYVDLKCNYKLMNQLEDFDAFVKKEQLNLKSIRILTSLIWLNMASLYDEPLRSFLFYFGKWNLWLSIYHTDL